jgi:hypothetical protein
MMNDTFSCLFWVRAFPARTDLSIPIWPKIHESIRMLHLGTEPSLRRVQGERFLPHNFMKKILVIGGWSSEDGLLTSHHRQIPRLQTARLAQSSLFVVIGEKGGDVATGMDS